MNQAETRQHHIVPAFYLAGFTDTGRSSGLLHVFDYFTGESYRARPTQAARQRDFYRVEEPGVDRNAVERQLGAVENSIAPVLRQVIARGTLASPAQLGTLLSLASLVHARGRKGRAQIAAGLSASLRTKLLEGEVDAARWDQLIASEIRFGTNPSELPSYDEARQLADSNDWEAPAARILQVGLISKAQEWLFDGLVDRRWELMRTDPDDCGGFITSDSPLVWGQPSDPRASLDDPDIEVTFPVSKSLALVSYPTARRATLTATPHVVAHVNTRTHLASAGLLFGAVDDFMLLRAGSLIDLSSKYFAYVRAARQAGVEQP